MGTARPLRNPALRGLRVWPVEGFEEFLICYVMQGDTLRVIRVLHGKREIDRILKKEAAEDDIIQ
jgi:toxin ParE1/3/4